MTALTQDEVSVLESLDPALQPKILALRGKALAAGLPCVLVSGWRSDEFQRLLYEHPELRGAGNPAAKPRSLGGSGTKHELGMACDMAHGTSDLQHATFATLAEALGLVWGGRFKDANGKPTPDYNHVEAPQSVAELATYRAIRAWGME